MIDDEDMKDLAEQLADDGVVTLTDEKGNRMVLAYAAKIGMRSKEFMLAYEKAGVIFFTSERPMNKFRLVDAGFSLLLAPALADMVNRLFAAVKVVVDDRNAGQVPIGEMK
jgi:hypothetical protein